MAEKEFRPQPRVSYVTFETLARDAPLRIAAQLRIPAGDGAFPAVVIVHGTNGVDSRGAYHARALNEAGIATLEVDMWSPRGLYGGAGPGGRPEHVAETLPDAFGALRYLAGRRDIDPVCIGIMGFSWGGVVSMLTATRPYRDRYLGGRQLRFAAHAPFYPICWGYNRMPGYEFADLTGAPVLIQTGECDGYDKPDTCATLAHGLSAKERGLVNVEVYPDAAHAFDRLEPGMTVNDPYSHLGQGGDVRMEPNPDAAERSRQATVEFFRRVFMNADRTHKGPTAVT